MREIVLDTETTGRDPLLGDRIVEIGALELVNQLPTGRHFHVYLDPERDVPEEVVRIHGLTRERLTGEPKFREIADDFLAFLGEARLVIHNASFDLGFLNAELAAAGRPRIAASQALDTLEIARRRFPGAQASLDALCRRFDVDNSARTLHGALLDCELLAEVYLHLEGGRQRGLGLDTAEGEDEGARIERPYREPRPHGPTPEEAERHVAMLERLTQPLWRG